jgi:hypothetical protein
VSQRGGRGRIFDAHVEAEDVELDDGAAAQPVGEAVAAPAGKLPLAEATRAAPVAAATLPPGVVRTAPGRGVQQATAAPASPSALAQVQSGGAGALARFAAGGQAVLADGAWRLRQLGTAGLVGVGLLVGAAVLYTANTLPQGQAIAALKAQLAKLGPMIQGGTATPQAQVALGGLPSRDDAPDVLGRIYQEAQSAGVELPRGDYEYIPGRDGVAAHYRMTFPVHTGYPQLRTFMDRTLIALPSVAVEGLKIERKSVTDETVDAELKLAAFVRDGT